MYYWEPGACADLQINGLVWGRNPSSTPHTGADLSAPRVEPARRPRSVDLSVRTFNKATLRNSTYAARTLRRCWRARNISEQSDVRSSPHRQRCSGLVCDRPSASRPVPFRQNRLQRRPEAVLTSETRLSGVYIYWTLANALSHICR